MEICNFELAKKLKEKGFREECFAHYPICGEDYEEYNCIEDDRCGISLFDLCRCYNNEDSRLIDAPTISQVLKWLRDEKGLHICISLGEFSDWVYDISKIEGNVFCEAMDDFHSYEEAALAGVNYCLENLI